MLLEKMSKEEIINLLKDHLLRCIKNIKIINKSDLGDSIIQFSKGHCYLLDTNEGGTFLKDDNGNWIDLDWLREKHRIDKAFVSLE